MTGTDAKQEEDCKRNDAAGDSRLGSFRSESPSSRVDSNQILNPNSSRRDTSRTVADSRHPDSGKIASQLKQLKEAHLAFVRDQNKQLENRIAENEQYSKSLVDSIEELENLIEAISNR